MEQNSSRKGNGLSDSEEDHRLLWNAQFLYPVHISSKLDPFISLIDPLTPSNTILETHIIITIIIIIIIFIIIIIPAIVSSPLCCVLSGFYE
jgi:hypothetical protein